MQVLFTSRKPVRRLVYNLAGQLWLITFSRPVQPWQAGHFWNRLACIKSVAALRKRIAELAEELGQVVTVELKRDGGPWSF